MSIQVPCPFFSQVAFLLLSCMSSLHILDVNPLSDKWFVNHFSHSIVFFYFSILLIVSFTVKKKIHFHDVAFIHNLQAHVMVTTVP